MHTVLPDYYSEIAYWWLRHKDDSFTIRQTQAKPDIYDKGTEPGNYPELASLIPELDMGIDRQTVPKAMRLGMMVAAMSEGCQNQELIDELKRNKMLKKWIEAISYLNGGNDDTKT